MPELTDNLNEQAEVDEAYDARWWETHDNVVTLCFWMADHHYTANNVASAVEKPWKWTDEYVAARKELEADDA